MRKSVLVIAILAAVFSVRAETLEAEGRVTLVGKIYMLNRAEPGKEKLAVANVIYPLRDALAAYEGKVVRVRGTRKVDAAFTTFETVDSVEVVSE